MFSFWRLVSFLPVFAEHVFPGYMFASSSLVFIGARVLILETCIVLAVFSEHVFLGYKFVSCSLVLSKHVLLSWKLGIHIFLLDVCTVYPGGFSGGPVLI